MPMATEIGGIVTYIERLIPLKSHEHIIRWSYEIIWKANDMIYAPSQCL